MKLVVLDGFCLNPGDLHWDQIQAFVPCEIYERTHSELVLKRARGAQLILTNKTILSREIIEALPELRYIGVLATGYNVVDLDAARERGITVTNIPAYSTDSVAQMVFAHLLNISNHVDLHNQLVKQGNWATCKDFCFWDQPLFELANRTLGIVGTGQTGMATARIAQAFGMRVIALTRKQQEELPPFIEKCEHESFFRQSDVLSLHCPFTPETENLINKNSLALMKPSAILINTGRGGLIHEEDLALALEQRQILAAGVDVLSSEPPHADHPLIHSPYCYITPHIAWATKEARMRLMDIATQNIAAFIAGKPINQVN